MKENAQRNSDLSERIGDRLVDINQVSSLLSYSHRGVYRLIASGQLPRPVKVGRSTRFYQSDIQAYLQGLRTQQRGA